MRPSSGCSDWFADTVTRRDRVARRSSAVNFRHYHWEREVGQLRQSFPAITRESQSETVPTSVVTAQLVTEKMRAGWPTVNPLTSSAYLPLRNKQRRRGFPPVLR